MGDFKITIQAAGGHGCDRGAKEGENLSFHAATLADETHVKTHVKNCPDCWARSIALEAKKLFPSSFSATLTHWPNGADQIVDDIGSESPKRLSNDFYKTTGPKFAEEQIFKFFAYEHLPQKLQEVSKAFFQLAVDIIVKLPRSAERTVALRKLLEGKDAAVRAAL